ncbi:MAG: sulfotransferase family 2 domain-containing protein [Leptolyngbyaceae cyanobacterium T60_A2020_046]|nr:sulfotransferase family 2 domain-containing protein [Leptolyngbyaceae cyanobacterium T60_A2020_046]
MTHQDYRLIWFQHFHKAGGTSIVNLAIENGETLYPKHRNGNPAMPSGKPIRPWQFSDRELTDFIDDCERQGVTFVATEWRLPNPTILANDPRVKLVTCLRDPLRRFVSNFYYDLYYGSTQARDLASYVGSKGEFSMFNYYCRILAQHNRAALEVSAEEFQAAQRVLEQFDCTVILENGFESLGNALGWARVENIKINSVSRFDFRQIHHVSRKRRKRWRAVLARLTRPKKKPDPAFIEYFNQHNAWDIKLYTEVKQRAALGANSVNQAIVRDT